MCLKETPGVDSCDYINASFIDVRTEHFFIMCVSYLHGYLQGYGGKEKDYIASQGW